MIRVGIVDDHPVARHGVEHMLAGAEGVQVAASVADTGLLPPLDRFDVVVHDLYLVEEGPAIEAVATLSPVVPVLVMSASRRPGDVLACIRAGARGYVTKDASAPLMLAAVTTVAAGGFALSPHLADALLADLAALAEAPEEAGEDQRGQAPVPLSPREEETLRWIARGQTHSQIARRMGISKATVDSHVERIRAKLHAGNKADLTRSALQRFGDDL
ncbi:response regulator transcription factor [Microbispora sp. NPDC046973]|uniref:response regulator transcription factor n=1 Tax=Microbispora sp. NPDC046973 TaxID=3155022 RepID=UPI0034013E51